MKWISILLLAVSLNLAAGCTAARKAGSARQAMAVLPPLLLSDGAYVVSISLDGVGGIFTVYQYSIERSAGDATGFALRYLDGSVTTAELAGGGIGIHHSPWPCIATPYQPGIRMCHRGAPLAGVELIVGDDRQLMSIVATTSSTGIFSGANTPGLVAGQFHCMSDGSAGWILMPKRLLPRKIGAMTIDGPLIGDDSAVVLPRGSFSLVENEHAFLISFHFARPARSASSFVLSIADEEGNLMWQGHSL